MKIVASVGRNVVSLAARYLWVCNDRCGLRHDMRMRTKQPLALFLARRLQLLPTSCRDLLANVTNTTPYVEHYHRNEVEIKNVDPFPAFIFISRLHSFSSFSPAPNLNCFLAQFSNYSDSSSRGRRSIISPPLSKQSSLLSSRYFAFYR